MPLKHELKTVLAVRRQPNGNVYEFYKQDIAWTQQHGLRLCAYRCCPARHGQLAFHQLPGILQVAGVRDAPER